MFKEVFAGKCENLTHIRAFVGRVAQTVGFSEKEIHDIELATDEACSNIIEHAYGGEDLGQIECTCQTLQDGITITLRDQGKMPFDPCTVPAPNLTASLEEREIGGLGYFLICQLMDDVNCEHLPDGGNILVMTKKKH